MTQKEAILDYIKTYGKILPAKVAGLVHKGVMLGSESSKRCREMRAAGLLTSHNDGKFEVFTLVQMQMPSRVSVIEEETRKMREARTEREKIQSLF